MPVEPYLPGTVISSGGADPYSEMTGTARMSHDLRYRYSLTRRWGIRGASGDGALWVMLNPSTADAFTDDATIRRCIRFSKGFGFPSLTVVNLFALRATDPKELLVAGANDETLIHHHSKPTLGVIGERNDEAIAVAAKEAQAIIVAWGSWGARFPKRTAHVLDLLRINAFYAQRLRCLGTTATGQPCHPSRLANDTKLEVFRG